MDSTIIISDTSADESSVLILEESSKFSGTKNPSRANLDGTINISSDSEEENEGNLHFEKPFLKSKHSFVFYTFSSRSGQKTFRNSRYLKR